MVDFINEVEEELRKDDYNKLLKRYGPYIAAGIAVIVAGTAFLEWREYSQDKAARATSASYVQAAELAAQGETDKAVVEFQQLAEIAPQGYAGLSLMRAAIAKQESGDRAAAVSLYDQAAGKFEAPRHKQLAQLKAAYILAGDGAYGDVMSRVGPLAEKDAPYEYLARELMGFAALQSGDESTAREQFAYLQNIPGVPESIKERATQSLSLMTAANASVPSSPNEAPAEITDPSTPATPDNATTPANESGTDNE